MPIESSIEDVEKLEERAALIREFALSPDPTYIDENGDTRYTLAGLETLATGVPAIAASVAAESAAVRAESAVELVEATAEIYPDEATGRAAVADGEYFRVIGSGAVATRIYKRTNSSTSVLKAEFSSASATAALRDGFDVVPSKNLYDKRVAVNGKLINYTGGALVYYADAMAIGYFPVEAGKTYTLSMSDPLGFHPFRPLYCKNAAGAYLGIDHTIGATPGMANPPTDIAWTGDSKVTFTIPEGSAIAYVGTMAAYSTHTTADFERVIGTVQAENGADATSYQRFAEYGILVPKDFDSAATVDVVDQSQPPLQLERVGTDIYLRTPMDASYELMQMVSLASGSNSTVNYQGARRIAKLTSGIASAWPAATVLHSAGDDAAPLKYNGTYIGANHGAYIVHEVTATGHGKTVADVGSEWDDGAGEKFCIFKIVDANKLWLVSRNKSTYPAWSFALSISGSTLTHSSGATHTGAITVSSSALTQLWPALQAQTAKVYLDGITEITADGTYRCTTLDIVNAYRIASPAKVHDFVRAGVGWATQPAFNDASIASDILRTLTYRYAENGSCEIIDGVEALNPLTLNYMGVTQANPLTYTSKELWQYVPRVSPKAGGIKTWNFQAQENISGTFELLTLAAADWTDSNNPPDRMAQIVKASGVPDFGLMLGYSPLRSVGLPATRKTLVTEACFISSIRKQYPKAVNGKSLVAGDYFEMCAFRAWHSAAAVPQASFATWYRDGGGVVVVVDFHAVASRIKLPLPQRFAGMDVAVVDKTASVTLHGSGVVTASGLVVSCSATYGYGVFRLS